MICWCVLDDYNDVIKFDKITKEDLDDDRVGAKRIVRSLVEEIKRYDLIVGYYSTKFDLPFTRAKAFIHKIPFPPFGSQQHRDVYYIIKSKFKLSRNRQEIACRALVGDTEKTHLVGHIWKGARRGRKADIDYVLEHCKGDVRDLQRLYWRVIDVAYPITKSI
jgi:DNA polymerase elongation subunit (family B)